MRDTANGEKKYYYRSCLSTATTARIPAEVANALYQEVVLSDPKIRQFAHPYDWAAFSYIGA